jgi:hypothetical protein
MVTMKTWRGIPMVDRERALVNDLCRVIARHSPFSIQDIHDAYDALQSVDRVLCAVQDAMTAGCPLHRAVMAISGR